MAHVSPSKAQTYQEVQDLLTKSSVIGIVNIEGIPAPQMLQMRKTLRGSATLKVVKKKILRIALKEAEKKLPGLSKLSADMEGQCGLIVTDSNPFKLYQMLKKTITPTPAKGGEKAPQDIVVNEGETNFKPGPIVGDLGKAGIPAAIDKGKVVIKKTVTVVKQGAVIQPNVAQALTKLEIYPLLIGMNLKLAYEKGTIYKAHDLDIDLDVFKKQVQLASAHAFNLAMFASIATPTTIKPLIQKAQMNSMALSLSAGIPTKHTMNLLLAKAYMQMFSVASKLSDGLDDELKAQLASKPAPSSKPKKAEASGKKPEKKEEEKKATEEEAMGGLGSLFG